MNRLLLAGVLSCAVSVQALAALPTGTAAPTVQTQASLAGKACTYDLTKALKKGPVVVYYYPGAFTVAAISRRTPLPANMDKFKQRRRDRDRGLARQDQDPRTPSQPTRSIARASSPWPRMRMAGDRGELSSSRSCDGRPEGMKDPAPGVDHRSQVRRAHHVHHHQGRQDRRRRLAASSPTENVMKSLAIVQDLAAGKPAT